MYNLNILLFSRLEDVEEKNKDKIYAGYLLELLMRKKYTIICKNTLISSQNNTKKL